MNAAGGLPVGLVNELSGVRAAALISKGALASKVQTDFTAEC